MSRGCCLKPSCTFCMIFWGLLHQRELLAESVNMLNLPQKQWEGLGFPAPSEAEGWIPVGYRSCSSSLSHNNGEHHFWALCSYRAWPGRTDLDGCTFSSLSVGTRISSSLRSMICSICAAPLGSHHHQSVWEDKHCFKRITLSYKAGPKPWFPAHQENHGSGRWLLVKGLTVNSSGKGTGAVNHLSLASKARSHVHVMTPSLPCLWFGGEGNSVLVCGKYAVPWIIEVCISCKYSATPGQLREEQLLGRKGFLWCSCSAGGLIWACEVEDMLNCCSGIFGQ